MPKVLVLCPTRREYRDLPALAQALDCELVFDELCGDYFDRHLARHPPDDLPHLDILALIDETVARYRRAGLSGVTSGVGYPGMSVASIVGRRLALPGPAPEAVMCCEHKYYSRLAQKALVPEAVPRFCLLDAGNAEAAIGRVGLPAFVKPVKSCMSMHAHRVDTAAELREKAPTVRLPRGFVQPFDDMLKAYTRYPRGASSVLLESLLAGAQVSLEGYVHRGEVRVMGILDAILFPGTISFRRFQYPSRLDAEVQARMADIARRFINGIGYDNALFNIEMMYDAGTGDIHVIEVNPKIATQFCDLVEKVDGHNPFTVLLQLALGREPIFRRREGRFAVAATCVLRAFEDKHVVRIPSQETIETIVADYPDSLIEIHATPGTHLSDQMQDAQSFRYGLVNIGASSEREIEEKFARIANRLDFELVPPAAQSRAAA